MKKLVLTAAIICLISMAYYLAFFLPSQKLEQKKQDRQAFLFSKQTECKKLCENLYEEDKKQLNDSSVFNPIYAYNENKNACFYSGGWIGTNPTSITKKVVNCQTNKEVLTFMEVNNKVFTGFCDTCVSESREFDSKEKEYIGN